ncbi:MAG: N-(5'-phosphoribosyl)anthranilate isomerase [Betaproteobacteria bacterium RIFCSPLOWO2_02_FULL_66_14]|nr:MAG: N-(5'-phosphoribosyl)anthranilate isomerase [Betaproteobacteria bacterium RIFCSPLOWO2_02_FULL_66_14]
MRTRIKVCGITRQQDLEAIAAAGADAFGLVFFPPSPRCLTIEQAGALRRAAPAFLDSVALFVNPPRAEVESVIAAVSPDLLQFHGDEPAEFCRSFGRPYIKACRVRQGVDLLEYWRRYPDASAWLADAWVEEYGGVGAGFDWSLLPAHGDRPLVLSGGLTPGNVAAAVRRLRPWAVDVSSGVESAKGVKDASRIDAFVREVRDADG